MRRIPIASFVLPLALGAALTWTATPAGQVRPDPTTLNPAATGGFSPRDTPLTLGAAGYAKILCSAIFVSGREEAEARRNSAFFLTPEAERDHVTTMVDRQRKVVRVTVRGLVTRTAGFYGDQGCVIHPEGTDSVFFTPTAVTTTLPDARTQRWPMGDVVPDAPWPTDLDRRGIDAGVALAFSDPEALTAGMLVLHRGRIVAERYALGATADTQLESWSMGKSLTATLVGVLIREGALSLDAPAPVEAWQAPGDPRRAITISHLMRMSSGLRCASPGDADYAPERDGYPPHVLIYTGAIDVFRFATSRPLQFEPGTEGRYRNCDPITLGAIVRQVVEARGEEYLTWPQRALFDRIGIRRQVLEPDAYGNFVLSGFDYGTVRNWARLGLLYAQDGVWQGTRLLPEGFARLVSTPAPGWATPRYGGLFWINGTKELDAPPDAYWMAGAGGQRVVIIPSRDLVIVRLGHMRGDTVGMRLFDKAVRAIVDAVHLPG
ncbi:serine hydrolase [Luteitalea sp. TBR-22]|uniref:serine hydrolase domain-containing protein n=1 Tax=Luteitalea sp. TBR-22 TaxID=2802971 RepID=UPI001AF7FB38|nr:serine hydrolase [Luteitalea sp. TBR-22]BCS32276.1 serine hydrolase [Luteitalea sp. TBR-22]